jgi:hypothetical protein
MKSSGSGRRRGSGRSAQVDADHLAALADAVDRDLVQPPGAAPRSTTARPLSGQELVVELQQLEGRARAIARFFASAT